jgi:hypothetical protein
VQLDFEEQGTGGRRLSDIRGQNSRMKVITCGGSSYEPFSQRKGIMEGSISVSWHIF